MDLVLDIGNFRLKGALFEGDHIQEYFVLSNPAELLSHLQKKSITQGLISSVNTKAEKEIKEGLTSLQIPFAMLDFSEVKVILDVEEPDQVGHDRIANVYGALFHFPKNDCIVIDMGTAVTFDYIGMDGRYLGGAIYPGIDIGAKALAQYTDKLPEVTIEKPVDPVGRTTLTHIQSGLYWGLLGAVERISSEIRMQNAAPSEVKILATGGIFRMIESEKFIEDLKEIVDLIDPALTLIGIHEIMKEKK